MNFVDLCSLDDRFEQEIGQEGKTNSYPPRYAFPPQNPNFNQYPAYQMMPPRNAVNNTNMTIPPAIPPVLPPQSSVRQPANLNIVTPEQQRQWESQYQVGASKSTTLAAPSSSASTTTSSQQEMRTKDKKGVKGKDKKILRMAGGQVWEDNTLTDWDPSK